MVDPAPAPTGTDLGAGKVSQVELDLTAEQLKAAQDTRRFRRSLFWLSFILVIIFYVAFLYFVFCKAWSNIGPEVLILSGLLAAIPTILVLAVSRHVFKEKEDKKDDGDTMSIWQSLAKELIDVFKAWVGKK
jgi:hypothetical protein